MKEKKQVNEVKINPVPIKSPEIGIDTNNTFVDGIINAAQIGGLDLSSIDALSQSAQNREQTYELIDSMSQDDIVSAVLETYAEDAVQPNDKGQNVWVESDNPEILKYTNWLMESLNIDKHLYQWAYCLITYGDTYVRLFRKSDEEEDLLFKKPKQTQLNEGLDFGNEDHTLDEKERLTEEVKLKIYQEGDHYIPYVQMVDNPGEMFDLQKMGKTHGFIKAPTRVVQQSSDSLYNYLTRYKMKQSDIEIFDGTSFVHACLETTNQRQPETVDIYLDSYVKDIKGEDYDSSVDSMTTSYSVKRGQSILYNSFRIWRELNLLEMSAILNRLTKSAVVRILNVEVGDMPKEQVQKFMQRLKEKIEQKSAINTDKGMAEYINPGPIENTIYVPTHGGQGTISAQTIGGDFDPKSLVDIEYFRDKLFGSFKVPKQFFGFTDDGAGFNGGTSLTILSSRYGKSIKKIQSILCQLVTDILNLFLLDRGLNKFVNKFTVKMQPPATQEEIDRRTSIDNRIAYIGNLMQQLDGIEDPIVKLKIEKSLLSSTINDSEVLNYLQQYIDSLENKKASENSEKQNEDAESLEPKLEKLEDDSEIEKDIIAEDSDSTDDDSYLPTPEELNLNIGMED